MSSMKTAKELELSLLIKEANIQQLKLRINKAIEILEKYDDKESNYYVPVSWLLDILKGEDNEEKR